MLARGDGAQRPMFVQVVDQRDVDRLDVRIIDQRLIARAHPLERVLRSELMRSGQIAARDGDQPPVARCSDGRQHSSVCNVGGAQHAPPELTRYIWTST